jgi:hypothetical protein
MAKAFGILLIVLGVWLGLEIFTKGTDEAFGGIFATREAGALRVPVEPTAQRIRNRVEQSMKAGAARSTSGIDDASSDAELDQVPADEDGATDEYGSNE